MFSILSTASFFLLLLFCEPAALAQQDEMNARDAFWSCKDLVDVHANAASAPKPAAKSTTSAAKSDQPPNLPKKTASSSQRKSVKRVAPEEISALGYGAPPHVVETASNMLGLRYTMLKRDASGEFTEVLPSTVFHAGDRIRLSVMSNQPGYLYIVEQGSSGEWKPLFSGTGGNDRIEPGVLYQFPRDEGKSFLFDEHAGTEHLFLMVTKTPVADVTSLMAGLHGTAQPGNASAQSSPGDQTMAALQSRDLVVTTVDDQEKPAEKTQAPGETAVYVVNKNSGSEGSAMVVADLPLEHK